MTAAAPAPRLDVGRLRAVLFDLDDTLINWRQAEDGAMGDLARSTFAGVGIAEETVRRVYAGVMEENFRAFRANRQWWYVGDRLRLLVERLEVAQHVRAEALAEEFKLRVHERLGLLDGALHALDAAKAAGRKMALLTNGPALVQRPKVNAMDLERHFHFVGISGELGAWKPEAEAFRRALAPLGVAPHEALMVGDSLDFDLEPAKALGMQTAWVNPKGGESPHADVVVPTPGHLVPHLAQPKQAS